MSSGVAHATSSLWAFHAVPSCATGFHAYRDAHRGSYSPPRAGPPRLGGVRTRWDAAFPADGLCIVQIRETTTMTAQLIDGKDLQGPILERVDAKLQGIGFAPALALMTIEHPVPQIRMQTDPAFDLHISFLQRLGMEVRPHRLSSDTSHDDVIALVEELNADDGCDGVFLLVPPPEHIRLIEVLNAIDPAKELEGLHPAH